MGGRFFLADMYDGQVLFGFVSINHHRCYEMTNVGVRQHRDFRVHQMKMKKCEHNVYYNEKRDEIQFLYNYKWTHEIQQ